MDPVILDLDTINHLLSTMLLAGVTGAPYSTGIFETIVAVHFADGLAVEFFDESKSHIQLNKGIPDFKKAIIATWFRPPLTSLAAVADQLDRERALALASGDPDTYPYSRLVGFLPLVVFGPMFEGYAVKLDRTTGEYVYTRSAAGYNSGAGGYSAPIVTDTINESLGRDPYAAGTLPKNPSFIGIRAEWVDGVLNTRLHVHLQMSTVGAASWAFTEQRTTISDSVTLTSSFGPGAVTDSAFDQTSSPGHCLTDSVYPDGKEVREHWLEDVSNVYVSRYGKEYFAGQAAKLVGDNYLTITPDHWHQVLISFDLSKKTVGQGRRLIELGPLCPAPAPGVTVASADIRKISNPCKMWIALDDVNYRNVDVNDFGGFVRGIGPNDIATPTTYAASANLNTMGAHSKVWDVTGLIVEQIGDTSFGLPTYSYTPEPLRSSGHPIGIPCVTSLADPVHHVEMGEFKMWTGKSVDTGKTSVRRLFVGADGKPVKDPKVATKVLGQPVITFHGSKNWIKGKNTGIGGKFTPIGEIEKYKPDPSLHGPQSPAELKRK